MNITNVYVRTDKKKHTYTCIRFYGNFFYKIHKNIQNKHMHENT